MYFAKKEGKELVTELQSKAQSYYKYLQSSGRIYVAKEALKQYYIAKTDSVEIRKEKHGRLKINIAELRNITQYTMSLLANKPTAFDPVAVNSDARSQYQAKIAKNIIDYYVDQRKLDAWFKKNLELAIVTSEAWGMLTWDTSAGAEYSADEQGEIYQGDIVFSMHDMSDVIRDAGSRKNGSLDWVIVRRMINKYELSYRYPEFAKQIEALAMPKESDKEIGFDDLADLDTDQVYYYEFRHRKSPILSKGKLCIYIDSGDVLEEGDLPYQDLAIEKLSPSDEINSAFSWTTSFDLIGFQQAISKLYSIVLTNQAAFGYQNIVGTKGSGISVSELGKGLRYFEVNQGHEIKGMDLLRTPQEIFTGIDFFSKKAEAISGLNSVVRGNPEASLKSGTALALVASQAVSYLNSLDSNYNNFQEKIATGIVNLLKRYANTPRMIAIAGAASASTMSEFTNDDLDTIDRVIVKPTNPMTKTIAGRVNLADMMLNAQQIMPEQYENVIATGQIQQIFEGKTAEVTLVKRENEEMSKGNQVPVIRIDNHALHIQEHKVLIADPTLRADPERVGLVLQHIAEHEQFLAPQYPQGGMENADQAAQMGQQMAQPEAQAAMPGLPPNSPEYAEQAYQEMQGQPTA